jgi:3-hydroxymyristoyl/3-hydroxydecanoyl-(acyl carrier protein) dehydratase
VIEALRTSILVPRDHLHIKHERASQRTAAMYRYAGRAAVTDAIGCLRDPAAAEAKALFPAPVAAFFCTGTAPMAIKTRTAPIW